MAHSTFKSVKKQVCEKYFHKWNLAHFYVQKAECPKSLRAKRGGFPQELVFIISFGNSVSPSEHNETKIVLPLFSSRLNQLWGGLKEAKIWFLVLLKRRWILTGTGTERQKFLYQQKVGSLFIFQLCQVFVFYQCKQLQILKINTYFT